MPHPLPLRHPHRLRRFAAALFVAAIGAAAAPAHAVELTVSAAASLAQAFTGIGKAWEAAHPGHTVRLNVAASGVLLQQVARGAPVDVLASADAETLDEAERQRLLKPGSRADIARNALVVVVPADAKVAPASLGSLAGTGFRRIALGLPASVPAGRYAKAALEQAQLWRAVEPRIVFAPSVRQALDHVARGEAEAGFVYATDAALLPGKVRVAFTVPTRQPVRYPIAVVDGSRHDAAAQAFVAYVRSPAGQAILARHGFLPP